MTSEQEQFMEKCKKDGFDPLQMDEIRCGFHYNGLSVEQVKLYAKKEFNPYQMGEIRNGFNKGLSIEQVSLFARPDLTWQKMYEIRPMFKKCKMQTIKTKVALMLLES